MRADPEVVAQRAGCYGLVRELEDRLASNAGRPARSSPRRPRSLLHHRKALFQVRARGLRASANLFRCGQYTADYSQSDRIETETSHRPLKDLQVGAQHAAPLR